jgi:hypothetical protein
MIHPRFILAVVLMAVVLMFLGCHDDAFIRFVEKHLGTDWYGIYFQENKIGWLKSSARHGETPGVPSYIIELSGTIQTLSHGQTDQLHMDIITEFSATPPYSLLSYSDKTIHRDDISEKKIVRTTNGYQARVTQGRQTCTLWIGPLDFTLKDFTAVGQWVVQTRQTGDTIKYPYLNAETFKLEENIAHIRATRNARIAGVNITYYEVTTAGPDGLDISEVFGSDGRAYQIVLGGLFQCRLEPQALATQIDAPIDFFVRNIVSVQQNLGDPENVIGLTLSMDPDSGVLLGNAPGQSVRRNPSDKAVIVTIKPDDGFRVTASDEEIKENLKDTIRTPTNYPQIIDLAHQAVDGARTNAEKVNRLVQFVSAYIEDDYTSNPLTLQDTLEKRTGDCSEHARLFEAMSRSLGIACRTVGGLVYLGDAFKGFGLHAWNEVVIDGQWVPVDPTWNQTLIDATHIRFPIHISQEFRIMAAIPHMKLTVLNVEHKK